MSYVILHIIGPCFLGACIHQAEINRTFAKLLEDALTRLAPGMGVDEGEDPECVGKAE